MKEIMLTTEDNPYDPFTQFDEWNAYDEQKGYFTLNYIARIAETSTELSEERQNEIYEDAIRSIANLNLLGNYKIIEKITRLEPPKRHISQ